MRWSTTAVLASLFLTIAASSSFSRAAAADLTITPTTTPEVSLMPFDSAKVDPRFIDLFRQRGTAWNHLRPYVAVLATQYTAPVKAVTLSWTVTDAAGQTKTTYTADQAYFFGQQSIVIVGAVSQLLLMPSGNISVNAAAGGRGGPPVRVPPQTLIQEYTQAAKVTVEIDAVIFQDGRVIGPDRSRTVKNLEIRDAAARQFVRRVRDANAAGEDLQALFATLAASSRILPTEADWPAQINASLNERESDLPTFWMARHARASMQSSAPMQAIDRIAEIPPLPRFFR
jgi:hypothetical protein